MTGRGASASVEPSEPGRAASGSVQGPGLPWLPWVLFGATAVTTTLAWGPAFSVVLLSILGAHELGHYFVARRVGVPASPPYFIPLPPFGGLPGTLGAVIGIGADRADRDQLTKVAVAGPIAGFVVAVPAFVLALRLPADLVEMSGDVMIFGRSVLTGWLEASGSPPAPEGFDREAHPAFFAAWVGLFVTGLNLLPMGQLDGGHLMYAVSPRYASRVSKAVFIALLGLGGIGAAGMLPLAFASPEADELVRATRPLRQWGSPVFLVWALLVRFIGLRHPPIRDERRPLSRLGHGLAIVAMVMLVLVFVPNGLRADRFP